MLAVALGNTAGYLAVVGYVVWVTAAEATHGSLDVAEILPLFASVPVAVGIGAAAGRFVPPLIAPIVAAVAPYVIFAGAGYLDSYVGRQLFDDLLPMSSSARDYLRLPTDLLVFKSLFWVALGSAIVCWLFAARRAAYWIVLVAGFALAGALVPAGVRIEQPQAYRAICFDGAPRVCVDRAHDHIGPEYRDRVTAGLASVAGLGFADVTIVPHEQLFDFSSRFAGAAPPGERSIQLVVPIMKHHTSPAHQIDATRFPAHLGHGLFLAPCRQERVAPEEALRTGMMLYHWWLVRHRMPTDGSNFAGEVSFRELLAEDPVFQSDAETFAALSDTERMARLVERRDKILRCEA